MMWMESCGCVRMECGLVVGVVMIIVVDVDVDVDVERSRDELFYKRED